jgi:hypothetical protein
MWSWMPRVTFHSNSSQDFVWEGRADSPIALVWRCNDGIWDVTFFFFFPQTILFALFL